MTEPLLIAKGRNPLFMLPSMANRHGLISGATGTGKTVTLQVLAERFSRIGVPVFLSDIKGDLSGLCQPGDASPKLAERLSCSVSRTTHSQGFRSCFGMFSASRDIQLGRPFRKWDPCCSRACSI